MAGCARWRAGWSSAPTVDSPPCAGRSAPRATCTSSASRGRNGFVRLFVAREPGNATAGPDREQSFLEAINLARMPAGERLVNGRPAGPCAYYPGSDAWTARPLARGVVLIGD